MCKGNEIVCKNSVKYLGAVLDQDLSGKSMGQSAIKKINKGLKFMYRKADFLDFKCRKMLCQSLLQSHFDYSCNVWYRNLNKLLKTRLQCAQNKIIRYIMNYDNRHHLVCNDFVKLGFLDVAQRVDYLSVNLMFEIFHKTAPQYLCNVDLINHGHRTRNSSLSFVVPHVNTQGSK